jgi:type II secretory pathway component PulF
MTRFSWPTLDPSRKLSAEEATELASRVADLTKTGLPLHEGLQALAAELPGRRLPHVLNVLAYRLEMGDSLDAAIASIGHSLPPHLRGLMLAGLRSGHLAEALEEYVDMERTQSEMRRRLLASLLYPFFLLSVLIGVLVLFRQVVMGPFVRIFLDFNCTLPKLTEMLICGFYHFWPIMWGMVVLLGLLVLISLVMTVASRASLLWWMLYKIPMLGPLVRWSQIAHFARLMGLLTEQSVPLPDALRLTSGGLRDANLALGCRRAAEDVDAGQPLVGSLAAKPQFPASMIPLVGWGQQTPALPDAFRAIAEMFEGRVRSQGSLLAAFLLPVMFLTIITVVGLIVIAMFLPLISLIQKLS